MALLRQLSHRLPLRSLWQGSVRTATSYAVPRDERFARLEPEDLDFFRSVLGENGVVTDTDALDFYNTCALWGRERCPEINASFLGYECVLALTARDWMGKYKGKCSVALRPKSTEQVSKILAHCNERVLAVVPQARTLPPVCGVW